MIAAVTPQIAHDGPPTPPAALITLSEVQKRYDFLPVLRGISLSIARGEFVALLGANGSGKSTLLRLISGLTKADFGMITVGGWQLPREVAQVRAQLGLVSHKPLLYEALTARQNLHFFGRLYNLRDVGNRIESLLKRVGLARRGDDVVRTYSRGMLQRLSIARALLADPSILLLDEPYTGLDQDAAALLDSLLKEAHHEGRTILMVTHELDRAARLAERVVILARGVIGYDGLTAVIDNDPSQLASVYAEVTGMASLRER